jgi:AcrR family transcriptional regulator
MSASAREQILDVAGRLFFRYGYHAVGIDTIIAEAGVAKATLYRHFPSKDALIVAYLERVNTQFWAWFEAGVALHPTDPSAQVLAVFERLQTLVTSPTCWGCPFLMAAGEFPSLEHPAHRVALAHKRAVRQRLYDLCVAAGVPEADRTANQLLLMMDGAFVAVRLYGVENPAADVGAQAASVLGK